MYIPDLTPDEQLAMRRVLTVLNRIVPGKRHVLVLHIAGAVEGMALAYHHALGLSPKQWHETRNFIAATAVDCAAKIISMPENKKEVAALAALGRPAAGSC